MGTGAGQIVLDTDLDSIEKSSSQKPLVQLVQTVAQSLADNTATAITFSSEAIDTDGAFNSGTSTTKVTPTRAGYYRVRCTIIFQTGADYSLQSVNIRKNGTTAIPPSGRTVGGANNPTTVCEAMVLFNGTTDYIEMMALQDNTANTARNTTSANPNMCVLELEFLRDPS